MPSQLPSEAPPFSRKQGIFFAAGPLAYWVLAHFTQSVVIGSPVFAARVGVAAIVSIGGFLLPLYPGAGRLLVTLGWLGGSTLGVPALASHPGAAFLAAICSVGALWYLWADDETDPDPAAGVRSAAAIALVAFLVALGVPRTALVDRIVVHVGLLLPLFLLLPLGPVARWRVPRLVLPAIPLLFLALFGGLLDVVSGITAALVTLDLTLVFLLRSLARPPHHERLSVDAFAFDPARILLLSFLATCVAGTCLLVLPAAAVPGAPVSLVDAAFTSVSATCVTGLIVLDTPGRFSGFGQGVILLLIQVGGLGIMTFSTAGLLILRQRLSVRAEGAMSQVVGTPRNELRTALRRILWVTVLAELAGVAILLPAFLDTGDAFAAAAWRACFTSVSAFCNAGFALQSDSLVSYRTVPLVLHAVAVLVVVGGLGPAVVVELPRLLRRRRASLQGRIVVVATLVLLVAPVPFILVEESDSTLAAMSVGDRVTNAWFQSVTTRTAGFNAVDQADLHPATRALVLGLMFVGGSPGSTAGGIKTTTLFLVMLSVVASVRGRPAVDAFGFRIPDRTIQRAVTVFFLGLFTCAVGLVGLLLTQNIPFEAALFEVVSAVGTVGLSTGATGMLDGLGKVIIILCMFTGRVGPITLVLALRERIAPERWTRPSQDVPVG